MRVRHKVLITTSGVGQRLGDITLYTNKVMARVGKRPVISHIIDSYPKDTEFIITLGHFGDHVKQFLKISYPKLKVKFVKVDKYQGPGSSLGYSMLKAKKHLMSPFIFHAGDTIVTEKIPFPDHNWNGGFKGNFSSLYSSFNVSRNEVQTVNDKGAIHYQYLHIGLVGIYEYKKFWQILNKLCEVALKNPVGSETLNDCKVINLMIDQGYNFTHKEFKTWFDTGNVDGLNRARIELGEGFYNLDKQNEEIYLIGNNVIKFYGVRKLISQKVNRAKILGNLVPKIENKLNNYFCYRFVDGSLYSEVVDPLDFNKFLNWCLKNLWIKSSEINFSKFRLNCQDFYMTKTKQRVELMLGKNMLEDRLEKINGVFVPSIKQLLEKIDLEWLGSGIQTGFHGDLVLDNVIKTKNSYKLIDWRQDFGGLIKSGDMYYDLAKINHNLIVNHEVVSKDLFSISRKSGGIVCDILRSNNLINCQNVLFNFLEKHGLDVKKIKLLTCLIWLNSAPLHEYPFNYFLFYFGKLHLWRILNEKEV